MTSNNVTRILKVLGISKTDSYIYIYLAKKGPKRATELTKNLSIPKKRLYYSLIRLQKKGIVKTTIKKPRFFSVCTLEELLEGYVRNNLAQAIDIERSKEEFLSIWHEALKERTPEDFLRLFADK